MYIPPVIWYLTWPIHGSHGISASQPSPGWVRTSHCLSPWMIDWWENLQETTGNHWSSHEDHGFFPVFFPSNQSIEMNVNVLSTHAHCNFFLRSCRIWVSGQHERMDRLEQFAGLLISALNDPWMVWLRSLVPFCSQQTSWKKNGKQTLNMVPLMSDIFWYWPMPSLP